MKNISDTDKKVGGFEYDYTTHTYRPGTKLSRWTKDLLESCYLVDADKYKEGSEKIKYVEVQDNDILYFDKTSKVPRGDLGLAPLTRCIKLKKNCKVVLPEIPRCVKRDIFIFENKEYRIIAWLHDIQRSLKGVVDHEWKVTFSTILENKDKYLAEVMKILPKGSELIYAGDVWTMSKSSVPTIQNIEAGNYTECVTDESVNKFIAKYKASISVDEIESIIEMIESRDAPTQRVALQYLCQLNADKFPCTIYMILSYYNRWFRGRCGITSVGVKNLKKRLNPHCYFAAGYSSISQMGNLHKFGSEEDKEIATYLLRNKICTGMTNTDVDNCINHMLKVCV